MPKLRCFASDKDKTPPQQILDLLNCLYFVRSRDYVTPGSDYILSRGIRVSKLKLVSSKDSNTALETIW